MALALELAEDLGRRLADDVGQHVQAPAVRHADDDLVGAVATGPLDQFVEHRDQRLGALEREALLPDIAGMHVLLDALGGRQHVQDPAPLIAVQFGLRAIGLEALLNPAFLRRVGDVHVLGADGAGVDLAQLAQDLVQRELVRREQRAGVELGREVFLAEAVVAGLEVRQRVDRGEAQRVDVRILVAAHPVRVDQAQHLGLAFGRCRRQAPGGGRARGLVGGQLQEQRLDLAVRTVLGLAAVDLGQAVEVPTPVVRYAARVLQVGVEQVLDEGGVGAVEGRRFAQPVEQFGHIRTTTQILG